MPAWHYQNAAAEKCHFRLPYKSHDQRHGARHDEGHEHASLAKPHMARLIIVQVHQAKHQSCRHSDHQDEISVGMQ